MHEEDAMHQKLVGTSFLFNTPSLSSPQDEIHRFVTKMHLPMAAIFFVQTDKCFGLTFQSLLSILMKMLLLSEM